jgi:uncharacterized protein (DUF885 family)
MKKVTILNKLRVVVFFVFLASSLTGILSIAYAGQAAKISNPSSGDIIAEEPGLRNLIEHYTADRGARERYYSIPFSSARRERFKEFNQEWLGILAKIDFGKLSLDAQVDYTLLKNHLNRELRKLENDATAAAEMEPLLPFAAGIVELFEDLQKMRWIEAAKAATVLNDINNQIVATQASLEQRLSSKSKSEDMSEVIGIKKLVAKNASSMADGLREGLNEWFNFYNQYDPLFTWWAAEPYEKTDQALQSYSDFLREELLGMKAGVQTTILMDPVGRDVLMDELSFEMIAYTPEEILALAWQELAWCEKERIAASRELGFGDDWRKAMEHVKNTHVAPGQQPELIRFLAFEAIEFLAPEEQKIIPYFGGGEETHVAYPTNTMPHEQKIQSLRGNNPHFSRAVVHHELIPGHHLQGYMARRYRTYRRIFRTPFFSEGWSLYWEMRLWDMKFQKSPEDRIGMLFWRMHRCARIIFSMSYQLGKMTGQECIDLVANRVGMELVHAAIEGTRSLDGDMGLIHMSSYLVGGLQIRALSHELVDSGKMTAKAFHDAVLLENTIPIELLRAKLTNQKLSSEFIPKWKFYTFLE